MKTIKLTVEQIFFHNKTSSTWNEQLRVLLKHNEAQGSCLSTETRRLGVKHHHQLQKKEKKENCQKKVKRTATASCEPTTSMHLIVD